MSRPFSHSLRRVGPLAALTLLFCGACTLLIDLSTTQCSADDECKKFGTGYVCSAGSCVGETADANTTPDVQTKISCVSNEECMAKNRGEPFRCDKTSGDCVGLKLGGICPAVVPLDGLKSDDAIVFGAFVPLAGNQGLANPVTLAYQLAINELNAAGGLPGGAGSPRRPLVAVLCDSDPTGNPPVVEQGVRHLAQTLHVPAVLTLFSQTNMANYFQDYFLPKNIFTLNPQDTTQALKAIDAKRLLWHLLGTPEDIALAYRPFVTRLEDYAHRRGGVGSDIRVAIVTSRSPTEVSISTFIRNATSGTGIVFNGKSPAANGASFFKYVEVDSLDDTPKATYTDKIQEIASFNPHILIMLTGEETGQIIPGVEQKLAADGGAGSLPLVLLSTRNARQPETLAYLQSNTNEASDLKLRRFFGIQYAGAADKTQYAAFLERYAGAYNNPDPATYRAVENFYDAIYWLAYGIFAAGPGAPLNGASFSDGVRKLLSGPDIEPGPGGIAKAFTTISNSSSGTTFFGALGRPAFDTASGAALSVGAVYCYKVAGTNATPVYDVSRYDRATGQLIADAPPCFIDPVFPSE